MTWIQTATGRKFDLKNPKAEDVDVRDIAHALANICRFNGHTREFYSVAQHSVLASCFVAPEWEPAQRLAAARAALLHDAHEAYVGDFTRPIKMLVNGIPDWSVQCAVNKSLRLPEYLPEPVALEVKAVDGALLSTEHRDLMLPGLVWETDTTEPLAFVIKPWPREMCAKAFLARFAYLFGLAETLPPYDVEFERWLDDKPAVS